MAAAGAKAAMNRLGDAQQIERELDRIRTASEVDACYVPANLMKPAECSTMIATVEERFGKVDILVNNAGIQH